MSKLRTYLFSLFGGLLLLSILTSVLVKTLDLKPEFLLTWETGYVDFEDEPQVDSDTDDVLKWVSDQLQTSGASFWPFFQVCARGQLLRYWTNPVLEVPERPPLFSLLRALA